MPIVKIEIIKIKTSSGPEASITGINPASKYPIVGRVPLPSGETYQGAWDLDGLTEDDERSMDLNLSSINRTDWEELQQYTERQLLPSAGKFI